MLTPLDAHPKAALHFSGGKDSLAVLHVLRPHWGRFDVVWVDTGEALPEVAAAFEALDVPRKRVLRGEAPAWRRAQGAPCDVVPVWLSPFGRAVRPGAKWKVQSTFECCAHNMWEPMLRDARERGVTLLIRGQREAESMRNPVARDGAQVGEFTFWNPIEAWSDGEVHAFLREQGVALPAYYEHTGASIDCWGCTGYAHELAGRLAYLREVHPRKAREVEEKVAMMRDILRDEVAAYG